MNIDIATTAQRVLGRPMLVLKKYSPQILMAGGITSILTGTVMACKATLRASDVVAKVKGDLDKINEAHELAAEANYTEKDYQRDLAVTYFRAGAGFTELYGPAALLIVGGIGMTLGSHVILNRRNAALAAAYKVVDEAFKSYRRQVSEKMGSAADIRFRHPVAKATDYRNPPFEPDDPSVASPACDLSMYAKLFDNHSKQWGRTYELNEFFLRAQQQYANDLLDVQGHVFLNEVYDAIGLKRTKEGAVVGWIKGEGDQYIDFGLLSPNNEKDPEQDNQPWILDFNVAGTIYDAI